MRNRHNRVVDVVPAPSPAPSPEDAAAAMGQGGTPLAVTGAEAGIAGCASGGACAGKAGLSGPCSATPRLDSAKIPQSDVLLLADEAASAGGCKAASRSPVTSAAEALKEVCCPRTALAPLPLCAQVLCEDILPPASACRPAAAL